MKILEKWKDKYYFATNYIYKSTSGLKIVYSYKPDLYQSYIHFNVFGGSYFERQIGVPDGTAHFAEHLLCNPNKSLKNLNQIREYKFGNRRRPQIYSNAFTSRKVLCLYADGNSKGFDRMLNYIKYQLQIDNSMLFKEFTNERNVILAEELRARPIEKDSSLAYDKFMSEDVYPDFCKRVIGTTESINSITQEHVETYLKQAFNIENCFLTIQSNLKPDKEMLKKLDSFAKSIRLNSGNKFNVEIKDYKKELKISHFFDDNVQGVFFSYNIRKSFIDNISYTNDVYRYLVDRAIGYLFNEILREKYNFIYGSEAINSIYMWNDWLRGFKMTIKKEHVLDVFNIINKILVEEVVKFLSSNKGKVWFKSQVSNYIFYPTLNFNEEYALNISTSLLTGIGNYNYDYGKSIDAAKRVTIEEIIESFKNDYLKIPPYLWFVSAFKENDIFEELNKSELINYWK